MSEVDESFDEDVVLSGPLHEYLQTCGDDGFPTSLVDTLPSTSKDASSTPMNDFGRSNLIDVTALFKSAKLEQDRIERVSDLIIHSNLIDSIDEHLIDEERVGDAGRSVTSSNSTALWSCVGCAVLSSVGSRFTSGRLANCFAAAAGVSAALSSVFMTSACWQRFKLRRFKQHVSSYIALEQTMDGNIRDAIRAVRQRQVVLYGLLSTNSEMKQSHLSAEGCFLPLRVALFSALRSAILHTRDETQRLAKRLCSVDELRNLTSSSSQCEFDALLSDSSPPVDLATIKAVWHWYYLLRSEYLRCVSWGMYRIGADCAEESVRVMKKDHAESTKGELERVKRMTVAGRALEDDVSDHPLAPSQPSLLNESPCRSLVVLQSLRLRLAIAQEWIDHLFTKTCKEEEEEWESELSLVERALDEARDCVRELQSNDGLTTIAPPFSTDIALADRVHSPLPSRVITADFEPTIDDQVFEAIVRTTEETDDPFTESDQHMFTRDNAVSKKTARSVLNELKTALMGRGEEMRQRERLALAQFRHIPLEQLIAEENEQNIADSHAADERVYSGEAEQSLTLTDDDLVQRSALQSELAAQLVGRFRQSGGVGGRDECRFEGTGDMIIDTSSSSSSSSDVES